MKPVDRAMDDDTIRVILAAERAAALGAEASSDLSDQRIRNYQYYIGEMDDMPAPDGQSSAVSTDVQDVVESALPIILDVLTGTDKVAVFDPRGEGDETAAEQETDYTNHVFFKQNNGFLALHNAIKDGLLQKNGYIKWWMEKDEDRSREDYKGLTEDAFSMITADKSLTIRDSETYDDTDPATGAPAKFYNVTVETVKKTLKAKIAAIPPEEILISKNARDSIQQTPYWAHVQRKPQADVIAIFPDKEDEIRMASEAGQSPDNFEANARETVEDEQDITQTSTAAVNTDMRMLEVTEHYIRLPIEKDKIARRYKITTIGVKNAILDIEEVSAWNLASGSPIIMPHRHFGRALADLTIDIQQIKTSILRATLNNAYFANNQRIEVSELHSGENTIDDLLNNRVGGIVRTKMPGGLNQLETQSIGNWTLPVVEYMDSVRDARTGVSKSNSSLDIDSMNHARTGAVSRVMDAAEMRIKLMTRVFAETLVVDTFQGLHRMLQEYSEEAAVVKLRGKWVTVDPREWKNRDHMSIDLPLGGIGKQQMLGFFAQILSIQKDAMQSGGGPNGPLVSWEKIYNTLDRMSKIGGLKGADAFFIQPPPPNLNAPPPPDPKMVEAQAKAQSTQQQTQAGIAADQAKAQSDAQLEQMKLAAKRQQEQDEFAHKAALDKMKFAHESDMAAMKAGFQLRLEAHKTTEKIKIDKEQAKLQAKPGVGEV